ncbi:MAG: hypothetical protein HKM93_20140 [Desulfobacteraceae bacterium]|nr:hypothetical protein [Desulfobacteraceae bacterium]
MTKRPLSPVYILFYILFWPDTWRFLMGAVVAVLLVPHILKPEMNIVQATMLHVMVACIGYVVAAKPAAGISHWLKRRILGKSAP